MNAPRVVAVGLICALAVSSARAASFIVEMEDYAARVPDDGSFAEPTSEAEASKRTVLFRFFAPGHVLYRLDIEEAGTYAIWLRYGAANEVALRVAVDPADEAAPDFEPVTLPATGGLTGPGVWGWARTFHGRFDQGQHTLAIGNAAFRPDCLYFTSGDEEPTDALITTDWRAVLGADYERALTPLGEVHPDWLDEIEDYRLPDWYEEHRVQLHTRLSLRWLDAPIFFNAAEAFRAMGATVYTRHIKSGAEGAWWASAVGAVDPAAAERNLAQEIIDDAHAHGCRIIAYHRHMEDDWAAQEHPDWAARDDKGAIMLGRRTKMCFNSPYADFMQTRLLELVAMGADGFYFDETHQPKQGCWCGYCRAQFTALTGLQHPPGFDPGNPVWQRLADFTNLTIERVFRQWRPAIHAANPECAMLVSGNTWPTLMDRHMNNRLFRIADAMKTEFTLPARMAGRLLQPDRGTAPIDAEIKVALGYDLARDAADGRPPHVWTYGMLDETSALFAAAGMMAHGCVANIDVAEASIPDLRYRAAFDLGERVSPRFARMRPIRWAALHYPERARDLRALDGPAAWREVLFPVHGAYEALFRARLPITIVTDSQLEEGVPAGCRVFFEPTPSDLTEPMRAALAAFRAAGGVVIENRPAWAWDDPVARDAAVQSLLAELPDDAPVRVSGGPELLHAVAFTGEGGRMTVALANRFTWVYTGRAPAEERISELTTPPPPCAGVTVTVRCARPPTRVYDAVTGQDLAPRAVPGGVEVDVPEFEYMAAVVVEP